MPHLGHVEEAESAQGDHGHGDEFGLRNAPENVVFVIDALKRNLYNILIFFLQFQIRNTKRRLKKRKPRKTVVVEVQ